MGLLSHSFGGGGSTSGPESDAEKTGVEHVLRRALWSCGAKDVVILSHPSLL